MVEWSQPWMCQPSGIGFVHAFSTSAREIYNKIKKHAEVFFPLGELWLHEKD